MRPRKWHLAVTGTVAATFFIFRYRDTGTVSNLEAQVERLVHTLPPGQRVMGTLWPPGDWRVSVQHVVDRACIGHCFSYGNYEPSTGMFQVRAMPRNGYVLTSHLEASQMESGEYVVQPEDLPVYPISYCGFTSVKLCMHPLEAGEKNGSSLQQ